MEFDGEAPGTIRDFASFQGWSGEFSEDPVFLRDHCAKVANSGFDLVRDNVICSTAQYQSSLANCQAHSTATRDHIGNLVTELTRVGVTYKPSLVDRAWGIERNATVAAMSEAAGAAIFGAGSLCAYVHNTTSTGFGFDTASLRRLLYAIWIYGDGGTFSIGGSGPKPGPNRSDSRTDDFMDALAAFVVGDTTDILTRMGWYGGDKLLWLQLFNGQENTRGIRREGYHPYFSDSKFDLKNPNVVAALAALYPGLVIPTAAIEDSGLAMQNLMDERAEWANKVIQVVAHGSIDPNNVLEDMQSVHIYWSGGAEPRVCGDPDVTKAPIVGEFNVTKPFNPRVDPRSGNARRSASDVANNPLNDNDEAFFFWLPVGEPVDVWLETNPQRVATIPANPTTQQVINTLCSLPGVGDPISATNGAREIECINSYNNTVVSASIYYYPPDGRAFNGFRLYMGHRRDSAGAVPTLGHVTLDVNNSVSKGGKMPRFVLGHVDAHVFQTIRGGTIDRGPFCMELLSWLHELGYRGFTYHTPFDPRSGRAADQRHFWNVAGYEAWLAAGRTRSIHDGGPHMAEEPLLYKWFWSLFPRKVRQWRLDRLGSVQDSIDGGRVFDMLVDSAPLGLDSSIRSDIPLALVPGNVIGNTMIVTYSGSGRGTIQCRNGHVMLVEITDKNSAAATKSLREFEDSLEKSPPTVEEALKWLKANEWQKRDLNPGMHFFAPPSKRSAKKEDKKEVASKKKEAAPPAKPDTKAATSPAAKAKTAEKGDETQPAKRDGNDTALPPDAGGKNQPSTPPEEKGKEVN